VSFRMRRIVLPFTAIVGQSRLKQALLLNAVNPGLQGLLVRGQKGTGKSTAVRALADLLPDVEVVECPFNCSPDNPALQCSSCSAAYSRGDGLPTVRRKTKVVELPLGATEDRVIGTLDIERALREGIKALEPGVLAEVNQGILYIDEVNLLDDHLVDVLLDSAAMGVNLVEREGISLSHPSRFILVGTMNPEEGEIRPQLLDRFGLSVEIEGAKDPKERIQIIKVVEEYEKDPESLSQRYARDERELSERILKARGILNDTVIGEDLLGTIAAICLEFEVHGHRADFLIARAAKTIAAFENRKRVIPQDVQEAAELVLPHRLRRMPFEEPRPVAEKVEAIVRQRKAPQAGPDHIDEEEGEAGGNAEDEESDAPAGEDGRRAPGRAVGDILAGKKARIRVKKDKQVRIGSGRRARSLSTHSGKYVKARQPDGKPSDIALDATIRACISRRGDLKVEREDLREKVRSKKVSSVIVFVVDASGSMAARRGMEMARRAVMALLEDSYQKRDKVGFVAVTGDSAEILLRPTSSISLAVKCLRDLPPAGRTPLSDGLLKGLQMLRIELWKNKNVVPIMVLVSDGRGNVPIGTDVKKELISLARQINTMGINLVVIDYDDEFLGLGYCRDIVEAGGGDHYRLEDLDSKKIVDVVKGLGSLLSDGNPPDSCLPPFRETAN
jgi:magnesium chelatase subunit D